ESRSSPKAAPYADAHLTKREPALRGERRAQSRRPSRSCTKCVRLNVPKRWWMLPEIRTCERPVDASGRSAKNCFALNSITERHYRFATLSAPNPRTDCG